MKSKSFWLILSCLMALSLLLVSCGTKPTQTTTPTTAITTTQKTTPSTNPVTTSVTTKPTTNQRTPTYGGTFSYRVNADPVNFDPYFYYTGVSTIVQKLTMEVLAKPDMKLDRNIYDFKVSYTPMKYISGALAESWELPDLSTYIFHIRKGVHWQNLPPANGRELTADDIAFSWNRLCGLGYGFTKPGNSALGNYAMIQSITATDKSTVVFKTKQPSLDQIRIILDDNGMPSIVNKDAVEKWGDIQDWKHVVGAGPYILKDYVSGSSINFVKNPDYWDYDDFIPQNRLPYIDMINILIIPDNATALAALRSGKIEIVEDLAFTQATSLAKTNPELKQVTRPASSDAITYRLDQKPFTDIRVRKAMQMSVDLQTIAKTYYGGFVDGTPYGIVTPSLKGFYAPYSTWPEDVKAGYAYNPDGAKKLLADAGYPSGFNCTLTASTNADLDLFQILKSYLDDIGVDMTISTMDFTSFAAFTQAGKHQMCTGNGTYAYPPMNCLNQRYYSHATGKTLGINDPTYNALWEKAKGSTDDNEFIKIVQQADMYAISQQWVLNVLPKVTFSVYQPWLGGFSGETIGFRAGVVMSRFWIDEKLKAQMKR
jgi:peptide/nickel transport system substrate-binding protein